VAINNSASPEIIWGLGGPEEDHQLHHCWTGRVGEREEEDKVGYPVLIMIRVIIHYPVYLGACKIETTLNTLR